MTVARTRLVIGGGGGLGAEIARSLGGLGDPVLVADADLDAARGVAAALVEEGIDASSTVIDVTDVRTVATAVESADAIGGGLGAVVNAAGVPGRVPFADLDAARWQRVIDVNLTGAFHVAAAAVQVFRRRRGGVLVSIASVAGVRPSPGSVAYSASKAGVVAMSRSLAAEVAAEGVRVWAVCPPAIETGMFLRMLADDDDGARRIAEEAARPLGRVVTAAEIAAQVAFLVDGGGSPYAADGLVW
jgi:NAD(P)-dependent dehydrogenase (short-subunit alcohol dehydrogenase family)